jgi:hypothetical protein
MERLNKILAAVQKFASKDYTYRDLNGILFDVKRQVIEATDGQSGVIIKANKDFVIGMANEYAYYLGLDPVGPDIGPNLDAVKLAPKNGKRYPKAERLSTDAIYHGDLLRVLRFGEHDPECCTKAFVHKDQFQRLNQFCKAVHTKLHLIPGTTQSAATMQYGKDQFNGMGFFYCIAQMPCHRESFYDDGTPATEAVTYSSLDEIDLESMKQFESMRK